MPDLGNPTSRAAFSIVGVGASAGGLEAFTQLLQCLPPDTGLAFVLIQHLDRTHPSLLSETLARATGMTVRQVEHGMAVEANHVYVIAPNTAMAIERNRLILSPRPHPHLPVDFFMRSLAAELGSRAIGVILSGSASDGTDGLSAIRRAGGITFVEDPAAAKFAGMPQSALDAGVADYCMDIPQLAEELARLSQHPYVQAPEPDAGDNDDSLRDEILARVRSTIGIDFSEFKPSTVARRLARRMALRRVVDLRAYLTLLEVEPDEIRALYEDLLVHVTSFFRDPDMFVALHERVFPQIIAHKAPGAPLRLWVAGCSTGEEVYSLAIALLEFMAESSASHPIQIFGSDVSEVAIQKARSGVYSETTMREVSEALRKRYFSKTERGYRINKSVRDLCIFVRHDLVRAPPFSKLDLASCRNVLIYLDHALQKRVLPTLHYCLNQPGFLVLGRSENISGFARLFQVSDALNKIYSRIPVASSLSFTADAELPAPFDRFPDLARRALPERSAMFAKHLDRLLLARYSPPGVLVNENLNVLLFRGRTSAYLETAPGRPQNNLVNMAHVGLIAALRATIEQAKRDMVAVRCPGVEIDRNGSTALCDLVVVPFSGLPDDSEPLFVVLFEEPGRSDEPTALPALLPQLDPGTSTERRRSARLEHELAATKEYLHSLIEEHGRASDELGTTNEELISGNEELQSMNEELETAKEELQSINEELTTLNQELTSRNNEVTQVNSDLVNFALTVDIAILTLDMNRRIRRYTPKVDSVLNVHPSDLGRAISEIKLNIDLPELDQQITEVMTTKALKESEVQDRRGRWYRMQIRPYTMPDDTLDGVILSLVDIHELKALVAEAQAARAEAERANAAKDDFLATLSHELRTPLSSMLLNAQRVESGDVMDRADLKRAGAALERSTLMQVRLIDDLLDVSRIVSGKLTLDCHATDLPAIIRGALDSINPLIEGKALALTLALDPRLRPIWADRLRAQQVVANLLTNAVKFTPRGGRVTLSVDASPSFARVRVSDTGIGIEAEFLPHVFARFSQRDSSITRKYGGLGLGLALVRHIVEQHGGSVLAESAGKDRGSTFSVTFPLARADELDSSESSHAFDPPDGVKQNATLAGLRVLFVDDDLRTREAVLDVLHAAGARVQLAASAAEGLRAVDLFRPDVIMCDIAMPGEDGYSFMRKLRAQESGKRTPIPALALTALASEDDRRRALAVGFQLHLAKPIDIARLREAVLALSRASTLTPSAASRCVPAPPSSTTE